MSKKSIYIIDGYNVLRCGDVYAKKAGVSPNFVDWTDEAYNQAREALLNDVSYLTDENTSAIIVYDSSRPTHKIKASQHVQVVFSGSPNSADEAIEATLSKYSNSNKRITVVSNDHIIQSISMNYMALRMSVNEFISVVEGTYKDTVQSIKYIEPKRSTIEHRIDADTLQKLQELSDELQ